MTLGGQLRLLVGGFLGGGFLFGGLNQKVTKCSRGRQCVWLKIEGRCGWGQVGFVGTKGGHSFPNCGRKGREED